VWVGGCKCCSHDVRVCARHGLEQLEGGHLSKQSRVYPVSNRLQNAAAFPAAKPPPPSSPTAHSSSKQQAASSKQQAASSKQQAASSKQQAASSKQASSKQPHQSMWGVNSQGRDEAVFFIVAESSMTIEKKCLMNVTCRAVNHLTKWKPPNGQN